MPENKYHKLNANNVLKVFYFTCRFFNAFHTTPIPTCQFATFSPDILSVGATFVQKCQKCKQANFILLIHYEFRKNIRKSVFIFLLVQ
jgi:hypothetical protein